jgi:hypothetical protein
MSVDTRAELVTLRRFEPSLLGLLARWLREPRGRRDSSGGGGATSLVGGIEQPSSHLRDLAVQGAWLQTESIP